MINNVRNNNISFCGTYKIDFSKNPTDKIGEIFELQDEFSNERNFKDYMEYPKDNPQGQITYVAPDYCDYDIETYLKNNGINFKKYSKEELFSEKSIKNRMTLSEDDKNKDCKLIELNTKEFDDCFRKSEPFYVDDYETIEFQDRYDGFKEHLKSGQQIDASKVFLREVNGDLEVCFGDGRHRYAVLRDMGFNSIPFAMDDESFELAEKYNLLN